MPNYSIINIIFAAEKRPKRFGSIICIILLKMNMKGIVLRFVFLVVACTDLLAQEIDANRPQILVNLEQNDDQTGKIEIIQPGQVENLLKLQIANNRLQKGIPGYRIRIFSQSGQTARQKAEDTRRNFMRNFPEMETYLDYPAPNWQVLVGDFRTKNEALRAQKKIEKMFPGAFIVNDIIQILK